MEGPNNTVEEEIISEETLETLKEDPSLLDSLKETFKKWGRVIAFTALIAGATSEASAKEAKPIGKKAESSEVVEVRKATPVMEVRKAVAVNRESAEYKKEQQVNDICHKNGFNIVDAHTGDMEVHLPPGEVKKVIVFLGQQHAVFSYDQADPVVVKNVNDSQEAVYRMLEDSHKLTGNVVSCIQEGVVSQEQADASKPSEADMNKLVETSRKISKINSSVEEAYKLNMKRLINFAVENFQKDEASNYINTSLYDMTQANRVLLESDTLSTKERDRLQQFDGIVRSNINYDKLIYTVGGSSIAVRHGHAKIYPGEDKQAHENVALNVYKGLGIKPATNKNFHDVIGSLPVEKQNKASELLAVYAHSEERELPAITGAQDQLKDKDVVVLLYGNAHTFDKALKSEYAKGNMDNTAMVKIETNKFKYGPIASK